MRQRRPIGRVVSRGLQRGHAPGRVQLGRADEPGRGGSRRGAHLNWSVVGTPAAIDLEGPLALRLPRRQGDAVDPGEQGAGVARRLDRDRDRAARPAECGRQAVAAGERPADRRPAELAGQPGRQPSQATGGVRRTGRRPGSAPSDPGEGGSAGGSKTRRPLRQRARPNQAVSRTMIDPGVERTEGTRVRAGSGRSRISREHSSARSRKRASSAGGRSVHQSTNGRSASSSGRTAPGSRSTARGPAEHDPLAADLRQPGAGRWQSAETSAETRRPGSSVRRSTIAAAGVAGGTVSSTPSSAAGHRRARPTTRLASDDPRDVRVLQVRPAHPLGGRAPEPRQLGLDVVEGRRGRPGRSGRRRKSRLRRHGRVSTAGVAGMPKPNRR